MGRMLEALKTLENRSQERLQEAAALRRAAPLADRVDDTPQLASPFRAGDDGPLAPSSSWLPLPIMPKSCALPTVEELTDPYLELAANINEQLATNYCNVVLLAGPDRFCDAGFSMTQLAQAVAVQSPGDVLLVDGDLIGRKLSKSVCPGTPGLVEVMLGNQHWSDVLHTTNLACLDFVPCGQASVPTLERSQFGWEALRPQYRTVLIGLAEASRPESDWLAARCDAVYLVISRKHTRRQTASAATNSLRASGANLMGCVVTDD